MTDSTTPVPAGEPVPAAGQAPQPHNVAGTKLDPNPLGSAPVPRLLLKFAPPAILSMMVSAIYNLIDTFFVGHGVGDAGIAATTVAFPLMMLTGAFAAWFGVGGKATAALRLGERKVEEANRAMSVTLLMLIVVPLVLTVVAEVFLTPTLNFLGATDLNREYSHQFCSIILAGFTIQAIGLGLSNFIRTDGAPNTALAVTFAGAVVSAIANYLLVMVAGLGMTGSAVATVIGQAVTTALVLAYFLRGKSKLSIRRKFIRFDVPMIRNIVAVGLSSFCVQVASALTSSMLNLQITNLGATDPIGADGGLTAIGTVNKVISLLFFVVLGFSIAAQPILGYNYGAQNYRRVRKTLWWTVGAAIVTNLILWIACRALSDQIMLFFNVGPHLLEFAAQSLLFMTLMFPVVPFQVVCSNYFQATGQPLKATILTLTRQLIFYLPALFIVPAVLPGITGLTPLAALPLAPAFADALAIIVTGVFIVREMGRLNRLQAAHDERIAAHDQAWAQVGEHVAAAAGQHKEA